MVVNANAGPARAEPLRLMVLGDSLTAGFGLPAGQGFTVQLEQALRAEGYQVSVLNAGVSGDTTAGGLARLDWALGDRPGAAIVELGANDALRGLDPAAAYRNLDAILGRLKQQGVPVLLAGMYAPPNYGRDYAETFAAIYPRLAKVHGVPLYPFFLEGVAGQARLNQPDGLHPNAEGVKLMVQGILPMVRRLLDGAGGKG
ncbi:arylesterase [Magnetospirillum sp. UT-4]|uniref:arylesterase n=1 Tax=Magnetospirillum sp. UT-4 TaxID=2681467 RepID=UPI0020C2BBDB|nr:arylesterase [Magnetospirillum sp. UT-4]